MKKNNKFNYLTMKLKIFELKLFVFLLVFYFLNIKKTFSKRRFSEKGFECLLPFTYNGKIYSDCAFSS